MFFQYAPFNANGGLKFWGHYSSENMIDWKYEGTTLYPDSVNDCHGVYSESAGAGRKVRNAFVPSGKLTDIRVIVDTTAVEIYLNRGEVVFSTRYYPENRRQLIRIEAEKFNGKIYRLNKMAFSK